MSVYCAMFAAYLENKKLEKDTSDPLKLSKDYVKRSG